MKELFNVDFHPGNDGFTMRMKNGDIDVPDEKGCYVLSTGCGSGKTECCKSIIRQMFQYGVLYCVDTIEELKKMYRWIMENAQDIGLKESDVLIISSDEEHREALNRYKNNPEILMATPIVLITHVRFWTDLINYFLIYRPQTTVSYFDGDFVNLMGRNDLRKYVLFDETPTFIEPFFNMARPMLAGFSCKNEKNEWVCKDHKEIKETYDKFFKSNSSNDSFMNPATKIDAIKRDVVLDILPKYFPLWQDKQTDILDITFKPLDLCVPSVNTHLLILEGAGNVLFSDSKYYHLLDNPQKYNSKVKFESFPFGLKRREKTDNVAEASFIQWLSKRLKMNEAAGIKTLVAVWMNNDEEYNTKKKGFYESVLEKIGRKKIGKDSYKIIYYGSSDSKSTNDYRDFKEIILAGAWNLPPTMYRFKQQYGVEIDSSRMQLWCFVQLLCRIGIRMHKGGEYTVCYSSDYSNHFINSLKNYFDKDEVVRKDVEAEKYPAWLAERFNEVKIRQNVRDDILKLTENDDNLLDALKYRRHYEMKMPLIELCRIIPRSKPFVSEYGTLIQRLASLDITLTLN